MQPALTYLEKLRSFHRAKESHLATRFNCLWCWYSSFMQKHKEASCKITAFLLLHTQVGEEARWAGNVTTHTSHVQVCIPLALIHPESYRDYDVALDLPASVSKIFIQLYTSLCQIQSQTRKQRREGVYIN